MNAVLTLSASFYRSSVGKKAVVAATGIAMLLFLAGHLVGNLLIFSGKGPEAINQYARWLHSLGSLLWVARIGLLVCLVAHVVATVQLVKLNRKARPEQYGFNATRQATIASRTMIWSGLIILSFIVYHLLHFTFGVANGYYDPSNTRYHLPDGGHNVYNMVVDGFRWAPAALFYLLSMGLLCMHLSHGFASVFQTLGLTTPKVRPVINLAGKAYALFIFVGNAAIVLSILLGWKS